LFRKTPLKAQNDCIFQKFEGAMAPLPAPGYAYVSDMNCRFNCQLTTSITAAYSRQTLLSPLLVLSTTRL